ncbi:DUF2249 domain-containing protein [Haloferax sp. YSMS24]|uniref:DUF2249 domain-containing protein n=1 Tax=unclassified Haloferax TaxID=2625095 RepID=UPI00398D5CED
MSRVDTDSETKTLDVREFEGEPFGRIMTAVDELRSDEALVLVNSFEPVPLFDVLESRGYDCETERVADDEWHITITPH